MTICPLSNGILDRASKAESAARDSARENSQQPDRSTRAPAQVSVSTVGGNLDDVGAQQVDGTGTWTTMWEMEIPRTKPGHAQLCAIHLQATAHISNPADACGFTCDDVTVSIGLVANHATVGQGLVIATQRVRMSGQDSVAGFSGAFNDWWPLNAIVVDLVGAQYGLIRISARNDSAPCGCLAAEDFDVQLLGNSWAIAVTGTRCQQT